MRVLPQQDHVDLGLLDDDRTEDLRPSEAAPVGPGVTSTGREPLRTTNPKEVHRDDTA
jgi:hypothetical protein